MQIKVQSTSELRSRTAQSALDGFGAAGTEALLVPGACCCCSGAVTRRS